VAGHRHTGKTDLRVLGDNFAVLRQADDDRGWRQDHGSGWKRVEGIEPSSLAWKAIALPLSYTRIERSADLAGVGLSTFGSGECRIRTCEGKIHQIYSLTPLTARETPLALLPVGRSGDGCFDCVPVVDACCGCLWWPPAGNVRVVDVTSGWQVVLGTGFGTRMLCESLRVVANAKRCSQFSGAGSNQADAGGWRGMLS
jgi:hypothetical protein